MAPCTENYKFSSEAMHVSWLAPPPRLPLIDWSPEFLVVPSSLSYTPERPSTILISSCKQFEGAWLGIARCFCTPFLMYII